MADGSLIFDTRVDTSGFDKGTQSLRQMAGTVQNVMKKTAFAIGAAFSVAKIVQFGKASINLASDVQEVQNVLDTAFGSMAYKMEDFADTCIETYGMSKLTAKQMGSTFMAMAKGIGQSTDIASDKAVELTGRLGDIMSFYNKSAEEVNTIGKAIYSGETEPLKAIGIIMTENNLKTYALAKGYKKLYTEMSAAEKLLVRQEYFLEQTSMAAGDFEKTQESWANQTRILSERWKEFLTICGNGLIQVLTPAVKTLNNMLDSLIGIGEELSAVFGISVTSNVSEEAAAAREEITGMGDSIEEAARQAEGNAASFDELELIGGAKEATGETSSGSVVEDRKEEITVTKESEAATGSLELAFKRLGETIGWLGGVFQSSFMATFGDKTVFDGIIQSVRDIKSSFLGIFSDSGVQSSAESFVESYLGCIGSFSGAFVSAGSSIASVMAGGIRKSLSQNSESVKRSIVSLFDIGGRMAKVRKRFYKAISGILTAFRSDEAQQLTADIITLFTNAVLGVTELFGTFAVDVVDLLTAPFVENEEEIRNAIEGTFAAVDPILLTLQTVTSDAFGNIREEYDTEIAPMLGGFKSGFEEIGETFTNVYNEQILPMIEDNATAFNEFANGPLHSLIEKFADFAGEAAECITVVWQNVLQPFINWFVQSAVPAIKNKLTVITNTFFTLRNGIVSVIGSIFDQLGGLMDFITGVFTGDWEKAWEGSKTIIVSKWEGIWSAIKTIINAILGGVEGMANGVVNGINTVIRAMNNLSFEIPDWIPGMGGETFGFNISTMKEVKIPRLATGTVVPANFGEFAAILGDNKREAEVVSPVSTMKEAFKEAFSEMGGIGGGTYIFTAMLDGREIFRETVRQDKMHVDKTGKSAFAT